MPGFLKYILITVEIIEYSGALFFDVNNEFKFNDHKFDTKLFDNDSGHGNKVVIDDNMKKLIDSYVMSFKDCSRVGAFSVAIVQLDANDKITGSYSEAYGNVDPGDSQSARPTSTSRFCIGSLTKQFTALTLGKILQEQKYSDMYDTKVSALLGNTDGRIGLDSLDTNLLTVRDLLSHKTGFHTFTDAPGILPKQTREAVWEKLSYMSLSATSSKFRTSMEYSNWQYSRVGLILQALHNHELTWEQLVQRHILQPLNMTSTTFFTYPHNFTDFALPAIRNTAGQYLPLHGDPTLWSYFLQFSSTLKYVGPAGSICTTANDMVKYMAYILQQNDTRDATPSRYIIALTQADSNNVYDGYDLYQSPTDPTESVAPTYGMGWFKGYYRGYKWIGHSGYIIGYNSQVMFIPKLKIGIFLSSTSDILRNFVPVHSMSQGLLDILIANSTWITSNLACSESVASPEQETNPELVSNKAQAAQLPGLENCTLPNIKPFNKMYGKYSNPIWGDAKVTTKQLSNPHTIKVQFSVGTAAHGCLTYSPSVDLSNIMRIRFDSDSYLSLVNVPQVSLAQNNKIEFWNFNSDGTPLALTYYFLDGQLNKKVVGNSFYRAEFNVCSSEPCQNGGTCGLDPDFVHVFRCNCPAGFTGLQCQNAPKHDCNDLHQYHNVSLDGIYGLHPENAPPFSAYCQFQNNQGWTIIQRRTNDNIPFIGDWNKYLYKFGQFNGSHWLGLKNIATLANVNQPRTLQIELCDCEQSCVWEQYNNFWLGDESDQYRLHIDADSAQGSAGSGLTFGSFFTTNNVQFSTQDKDNDRIDGLNCAHLYKGGWWYNECYASNLNGVYYENCAYPAGTTVRDGVEWIPWKMIPYSLYYVQMKIM